MTKETDTIKPIIVNGRENIKPIFISVEPHQILEGDTATIDIPGTTTMAHATIAVKIPNATSSTTIEAKLYNPGLSTSQAALYSEMNGVVDYNIYDESGQEITLPIIVTLLPGEIEKDFYIEYLNDTSVEGAEIKLFALSNLENTYAGSGYVINGFPFIADDDDDEVWQAPVDIYIPPVTAETKVRKLSSGSNHSCAILSVGDSATGPLTCWGANFYGQLGNGSVDNISLQPVFVDAPEGIEGWHNVSTGSYRTCAVSTNDSELYCWGEHYSINPEEILYLGSPTLVPLPSDTERWAQGMDKISTGNYNTCAITLGEQLYCWGLNVYGNLGIGSSYPDPANMLAPDVFVDNPANVVGWKSIDTRSGLSCGLAKKPDSNFITGFPVYCWGEGFDDDFSFESPELIQLPIGVTGINEISINTSSGVEYLCGLANSDDIYCWGAGTEPYLVDTSNFDHWEELLSTGYGGMPKTCGVTDTEEVYCWEFSPNSGAVSFLGPAAYLPSAETWSDLSVGGDFACGRSTESIGYCYSYGPNAGWQDGQLGDGSMQSQSEPVLIAFYFSKRLRQLWVFLL